MNGHGVQLYANGDRYEGEFQDRLRHGHGVYIYANGNRLEGAWQDGQFVTS